MTDLFSAFSEVCKKFEFSDLNKSQKEVLRYQCTPNDHHSSAPLYGRTVDANPTKVIFSESLLSVDYDGLFTNVKKFKVSRI